MDDGPLAYGTRARFLIAGEVMEVAYEGAAQMA
jgi:hypothetical protein